MKMSKKILTIGIIGLFMLTGLTGLSAGETTEEADDEEVILSKVIFGGMITVFYHPDELEILEATKTYTGPPFWVFPDAYKDVKIKGRCKFVDVVPPYGRPIFNEYQGRVIEFNARYMKGTIEDYTHPDTGETYKVLTCYALFPLFVPLSAICVKLTAY